MAEIKCLNPWDPQSKRQYQIDGVYAALNAGQSQGGQAHGICYAIDQQGGKGNCGYAENVMMTLCSDSHGTPHALCYAIEGNVVDRVSAKNGKGWCEDVSPTLNTQDRHAIVYSITNHDAIAIKEKTETLRSNCHQAIPIVCQLCGDRDDPSVSVSEIAYCIPANPMSDRGQAVCYALEGNGSRPSHMGKGFNDDGTMYTLNTIEQHSVCYSVDCRNNVLNKEMNNTLQAKEQGGWSINVTSPVLIVNETTEMENG